MDSNSGTRRANPDVLRQYPLDCHVKVGNRYKLFSQLTPDEKAALEKKVTPKSLRKGKKPMSSEHPAADLMPTTKLEIGPVADLPTLADQIKATHAACVESQRDAFRRALECGRLLLEARTTIQHGAWQAFVVEQCGLSHRSASRYVAIARAFDALPESAREEILSFSLRKAMTKLAIEVQAASECEPDVLPAVVKQVRETVLWPEDEEDLEEAMYEGRSIWGIAHKIARHPQGGRRGDRSRESDPSRRYAATEDTLTESERAEASFAAFVERSARDSQEPGQKEPNVLSPTRLFTAIPDRLIESIVDNLERDTENCVKYSDRFTDEQQDRIVQAARTLLEKFGN